MNKFMRKLIGGFVVLALLVTSVPLYALAGDAAEESEITGAEEPSGTSEESETDNSHAASGPGEGAETDQEEAWEEMAEAEETLPDPEDSSDDTAEDADYDTQPGESEQDPEDAGEKMEEETTQENAGPAVHFSLEDVTVQPGDERFDLMDGVAATDEAGEELNLSLVETDGFDILTPGVYQVTYQANHPALDEPATATRTVTVATAAFMADMVMDTDILQALIDSTPAGGTITIPNDIVLTKTLTVNKSLTLQSAGEAVTLFSNPTHSSSGIRHIAVTGSSLVTLTFDGVVLDGGENEKDGGISAATDLTLVDAVIQNVNFVSNQGKYGGAVGTEAHTQLILAGNTQLLNNSNSMGGALYVGKDSTAEIGPDVLIQGNTTANRGGGVYLNTNASLTVYGQITGNTAQQGGGIYAYTGSSIHLDGGKVNSNYASLTASGIAAWRAGSGVTLTMDSNAQINNNTGTGGSRAAAVCVNELILNDGTINYNQTTDTSVIAVDVYDFTMHGGEIRGNTLDNYYNYLGMYNTGTIAAENVTMTGGLIADNNWVGPWDSRTPADHYFWGGAIYLDSREVDSVVNITGGTFRGNGATYGGALYLRGVPDSGDITINIENAVFENNKATKGGGAIRFTTLPGFTGNYQANIKNTTFTGNEADGLGGSILVDNNATASQIYLTVGQGNVFTGNWSKFGSALYNENGNIVINGNALFQGNTTESGGAVYNYKNGVMNLTGDGMLFKENRSGSGGALYNNKAAMKLSGNITFESNYAASYGGALYNMSTSTLDINGSAITFTGNRAESYGGAIMTISTDDKITLGGTVLFSGNTGTRGGAIYTQNSGAVITGDVSFTGNEATMDNAGGAIYTNNYSQVTTQNVRFSGNKAPKGYTMTDPDDIATYNANIQAATVSVPFTYAYNNLDINYTAGDETEIPQDITYTLTFHANGGIFADQGERFQIELREGDLIEAPIATRDGYTLTGWYTAADNGVQWDLSGNAMPGNDLELFAGWQDDGSSDGGEEDKDEDEDKDEEEDKDKDDGTGDGGDNEDGGDNSGGDDNNGGNETGGGNEPDGGGNSGGGNSSGGSDKKDEYPGDSNGGGGSNNQESSTSSVPSIISSISTDPTPLSGLLTWLGDSEVPLGTLPRTGDNSPINEVAILAGAALLLAIIAGASLLYTRRRD